MLEDPRRIDLSLEPLDDYVVIEPVDEETETRAGLIIPASSEAGCRSGIVTATGADATGVEPGDKCCSRRTPASTSASPARRSR
jgi:hypothetical protein